MSAIEEAFPTICMGIVVLRYVLDEDHLICVTRHVLHDHRLTSVTRHVLDGHRLVSSA